MAETKTGKCIKIFNEVEERFLLDYTNRRRVKKCAEDTLRANEDRRSENDQEFENLCKKIEECSISKMPLLRKPNRKCHSGSTSSSASSSTSLNHVHKDVEDFQNFLEENGGHYGGWKVKDHLFFVKVRNKYPLSKTAEIVSESFPDISTEKVKEHDNWYKEYIRLRAANKRAIEEWKNTRKPPVKVKHEEKPEPKTQNCPIKRDPNIKQKIEVWKAHTLAAKLERLQNYEKEEMRKRKGEEEKLKLQEEKRATVNRYREEKLSYEMAMKTAKEIEIMEAKQHEMRRSAMLLKFFRYEDRRFTDRKKAKKQQKQKGKEEVKRKSSVDVKRDPNRLLQPTLGWIYHTKKTEDSEKSTPLYIQHLRKLGKPDWRKNIEV